MSSPNTGTATHPQARARPVRWLHPDQLIRTGLDTVVSKIFGDRADHRLMEAIAQPQPVFFNYSGAVAENVQPEWADDGTGELWLDYAADLGDGWDAAYSVAYWLSRPTLQVTTRDGQSQELKRGRLLVFGGDEVYPVASRKEYEQRLVYPYETANRSTNPPHPHVYAIPGNHDWYDGLVSFLRLFCAGRWFAGWKTRQSRSYFALKLPRGWWLLGTDVQLESDIDAPQVQYFRAAAERMAEGDRVILCNAEPAWIYESEVKMPGSGELENNLTYLEQKVLGNKVAVFLAGDLHHYRRHANDGGVQKITAGGGGAFLHPTHGFSVDVLKDGSRLQPGASFPPTNVSRRLTWGCLALLRHNPRFGLVTGVLYALLALAGRSDAVGKIPLARWSDAAAQVLASVIDRPWALALGALTALGCVAFADARVGSPGRWALGLVHAALHVVAAFFVAWTAIWFAESVLGICTALPAGRCVEGWTHQAARMAVGVGLTFCGGFLVGPCIMGAYLLTSLNGFGAHPNEAFSSIAIQDYKSFLRMRIARDGTLTIFPIGIERVAHRWKDVAGAKDGGPEALPDDPRATSPRLIEDPIVLRR